MRRQRDWLAAKYGIEKCEPNAGDDPTKDYWWNGFDTFNTLDEAIADAMEKGK